MVTVARIVLMPIPGYLLFGGASELFAALLMIIVIGLTDWIDGIMARREGPSVLGGLLDPIADKIFIAAIYLPLTERGVIPIWMTACIFARDFVVTTLRTSLSLRDAPMRTATLAKYKTATQMMGIGYVTLYLAHTENPASIWVWAFIIGPIFLPLGLILYRFATKQKQGPRSVTMMSLMIFAVAMRAVLGPDLAIILSLWIITTMTVVSGFSYLSDAWGALRGTPGSYKEGMRFILDGILVPVAYVLLLNYPNSGTITLAIILVITVELTLGGLGNLLASRHIVPRFRWMAIKSILQLILAGTALLARYFGTEAQVLAPDVTLDQLAILSALFITVAYAGASFWRHRSVYLAAI